jgi:hypothetical protein
MQEHTTNNIVLIRNKTAFNINPLKKVISIPNKCNPVVGDILCKLILILKYLFYNNRVKSLQNLTI